MKTVFLCGSNLDGILTGVYDIYASGLSLSECRLELEAEYEPDLFSQYRSVTADSEKAGKVAAKVRSRMSDLAYLRISRAALHKSPDRADWIFRFIRLGLRYGKQTLHMLQNEAVYEIFQMDRYVGNEAHALVEFTRFQSLKSGILLGKVGPENDVLELVAAHFADRFPDADWVLYDDRRKKAALHEGAAGRWQIRQGVTDGDLELLKRWEPKEDRKALEGSRKPEKAGAVPEAGMEDAGKVLEDRTAEETKEPSGDVYAELWKTFFASIAIEERRNPKCQRNMLPLRYRKYITEFCEMDQTMRNR